MNLHVKEIIRIFDLLFPNPKSELITHNEYELLIAVVLSAQTTDVRVNEITKILFSEYPDVCSLSSANLDHVENILLPLGLYRIKAKNIINLSKIIVEDYQLKIPNTRTSLEKLPGVGRKTANVVLAGAFNRPVIAVDTHVERVAKRLGFAQVTASLIHVEESLIKAFPSESLIKINQQMLLFGRYICLARKPKCLDCKLRTSCKYI